MKARFHRGLVSDLEKDSMFEMTWAPKTDAPIRVGADDQCASWKADGQFSCFIEGPEHELVHKWIPSNATVMEFGARFGTTTCEVSKKLKNSGKFVTVEPDSSVWGFLEENIKSHNCHAHVLRGAISSKPLHMLGSGYGGRSALRGDANSVTVPTYTFDEIEKASGLKFDTLLIDCEGCAQHMMDQLGPKIETQIKLVVIEADMPDDGGDCTADCMHYPKFFDFLAKSGFQQIDEFNDCDHSRSHAPETTWCGPWIKHYAFRKTSKTQAQAALKMAKANKQIKNAFQPK